MRLGTFALPASFCLGAWAQHEASDVRTRCRQAARHVRTVGPMSRSDAFRSARLRHPGWRLFTFTVVLSNSAERDCPGLLLPRLPRLAGTALPLTRRATDSRLH